LFRSADFYTAARRGEDIEPAIAREIFGDDDAMFTVRVVDLYRVKS
jgi:hypothetical protein